MIIEKEQKSKIPEHILVIQNKKEIHNPLFLIHTASGLAFPYNVLSKYITDIPIYGISNPYYGHSLKKFLSIEEMAAHYILSIKKVQPKPPYRIGGWSSGGLVAFEIAQQLTKAGEQVEIILLIDTKNCFNSFLEDDKDLKEFLASQGHDLNTQAGNTLFWETKYNCELAVKYEPMYYDGLVAYLKAEETVEDGMDSTLTVSNSWKGILNPLNAKTYYVKGTHAELFDEPYVSIVAKVIKENL